VRSRRQAHETTGFTIWRDARSAARQSLSSSPPVKYPRRNIAARTPSLTTPHKVIVSLVRRLDVAATPAHLTPWTGATLGLVIIYGS